MAKSIRLVCPRKILNNLSFALRISAFKKGLLNLSIQSQPAGMPFAKTLESQRHPSFGDWNNLVPSHMRSSVRLVADSNTFYRNARFCFVVADSKPVENLVVSPILEKETIENPIETRLLPFHCR